MWKIQTPSVERTRRETRQHMREVNPDVIQHCLMTASEASLGIISMPCSYCRMKESRIFKTNRDKRASVGKYNLQYQTDPSYSAPVNPKRCAIDCSFSHE